MKTNSDQDHVNHVNRFQWWKGVFQAPCRQPLCMRFLKRSSGDTTLARDEAPTTKHDFTGRRPTKDTRSQRAKADATLSATQPEIFGKIDDPIKALGRAQGSPCADGLPRPHSGEHQEESVEFDLVRVGRHARAGVR